VPRQTPDVSFRNGWVLSNQCNWDSNRKQGKKQPDRRRIRSGISHCY
jgi:hypothetical protein